MLILQTAQQPDSIKVLDVLPVNANTYLVVCLVSGSKLTNFTAFFRLFFSAVAAHLFLHDDVAADCGLELNSLLKFDKNCDSNKYYFLTLYDVRKTHSELNAPIHTHERLFL